MGRTSKRMASSAKQPDFMMAALGTRSVPVGETEMVAVGKLPLPALVNRG